MLHLRLDVNSTTLDIAISPTCLDREISFPILSRQQVRQSDLTDDEPRVDTLYAAILDLAFVVVVGVASVHVDEE